MASFDASFYRNISLKASLKLYAAIFFTFAPAAVIITIVPGIGRPWPLLVAWLLGSGLIAVGWASSFIRNKKLLFVVIPFHILVSGGLTAWSGVIMGKMSTGLEGALAVAFIVVGYVFFISFINGEGARSLSMQTEISLAKQIHSHLVPRIRFSNSVIEAYGESISTGDVGGDMIDLIPSDSAVGVYVGDVSGHGIKAGVMMGMVKSALRMKLLLESDLDALCRDLNSVVHQVKRPEMFVTFGCMIVDAGGRINYALAGHPPILHYVSKSSRIEELSSGNPGLGLMRNSTFTEGTVKGEPGDYLLLLTDGLFETVDKNKELFGVDRIKEILKREVGKSAEEVSASIMKAVREFGDQDDDQTLVVVRLL